MFTIAILIGIYSYLIFCLGLLGFLYKQNVQIFTIIYLATICIYYRPKINKFKVNVNFNWPLALLVLLVFVNLIGALGPELGFDALWYHLTLPKIYLLNHRIFHIPGGLLYYSEMPKLIEMLYVGALSLGGEVMAKLVHFSFGILSTIAVYKIALKVVDKKLAILASLIFYSNLVVGWMSITSYIDLGRTFFEALALLGFLNYIETKNKSWLIESAFILGLAISSKLLAIGSIFIFGVLLLMDMDRNEFYVKFMRFAGVALFVVLPWLVLSFLSTGNPIYPFLTKTYGVGLDINLLSPLKFLRDIFELFTRSSDPINPLYIIFIPLLATFYKKFDKLTKAIFIYALLSIIVWYFTPRTGGGRFILPYLPAFSVLTAKVLQYLVKDKYFSKISYSVLILVSLTSIAYRGIANSKYLPVLLGKESKAHFLSDNLNFRFGDFYDTDGFLSKTIKSDDMALLYGFHNLYYVDFPFVDSSFVKAGDKFNFIVTQNAELPNRFEFWKKIYFNEKTGINLYTLQGEKWQY